jgi:isopentenyl diphosphate isomerase/L-lactate dehydrogenase-like FMN-dependent dehydrogenase
VSEPQDFRTLHEIVAAARAKLPDGDWDYVMGAAETETTHRRNRQAIDSVALQPRVLRDVTNVDLGSTFLGKPARIPVFIAPIGSLQALDSHGAMAAARAAERFGVMSMLSSVTQPGLEEIAAGTRHCKVFQLYIRGDDKWVADYIRRVVDSRYDALCFTIDSATYSRRERDIVKRWTPNSMRSGGSDGLAFQARLTWDHIKRVKDQYPSLPIILKGIGTADDAALAVEHGVQVVYLSNHGGRQLDHGAGTLELLPEIVAAVGGRAQVAVDGGFYRGSDIVKAIALGAHAVGIGRLYGLGLAAGGEGGVLRVLELLEDEMRRAMTMLGVTSLAELNPKYLRRAAPVYAGAPFESAFPFLELPAVKY